MKNIFTLVAVIFLSLTATAQQGIHFNQKEYFTVSTSIDPVATATDGFIDVAMEIEYVGFVYAKAGIEYFPALEPSYFDWHGGIGVNLMLNTFNDFRAYSGIRLGRIYRGDEARVPFVGFEGGIDWNVSDNFFVGLRATYDYRTEGQFLGWDNFWRESGYIRIGYKWDWNGR